MFDVEAGQFLLGEQRSKVLEDNVFNALEDLEKEGHPGPFLSFICLKALASALALIPS